MIKDEFKSNQPFRAPEEYDVYNKEKEAPKKYYDREDSRRDKALNNDLKWTEAKKLAFEQRDQMSRRDAQKKNANANAINQRLEKELIEYA